MLKKKLVDYRGLQPIEELRSTSTRKSSPSYQSQRYYAKRSRDVGQKERRGKAQAHMGGTVRDRSEQSTRLVPQRGHEREENTPPIKCRTLKRNTLFRWLHVIRTRNKLTFLLVLNILCKHLLYATLTKNDDAFWASSQVLATRMWSWLAFAQAAIKKISCSLSKPSVSNLHVIEANARI